MVTIYDIAKMCGVSPSTISKVVNDYPAIPEATKEKVRKCMRDTGYIPNVSAKALSKGHSRNVGILAYIGLTLSPFKHPLFIDVLASFQEEMNRKNYDLLFIGRNVGGQNGTFYENCISRDVAGVLLFGDMTSPEMEEVIDSSIPKVAFDYLGKSMIGVHSDNFDASYQLTRHLINLGHKRIVFIHGEHSDITDLRIEGFKKALAESGIAFNESMLVESHYLSEENVIDATNYVLHMVNVPTAIMYPDDYSAVIGLKVIKNKGLDCPSNISITGFDGVEIGSITSPSITTIKQDTKKIGQELARRLIDAMEDKNAKPSLIEIKSTLEIRESTSVPRKGEI